MKNVVNINQNLKIFKNKKFHIPFVLFPLFYKIVISIKLLFLLGLD